MFQICSPSSLLYCTPQRADELVALPSGFWWGLASWGNRRRTREREWSWGSSFSRLSLCWLPQAGFIPLWQATHSPCHSSPLGLWHLLSGAWPFMWVGDGPTVTGCYYYSISPCSSCPYPSKISL